MYTFCYKVLSTRRQIPNRLSVFSVFNCRYSVFFGIVNTDVGVGIGISKYRISVRYFDRYTDPRLTGKHTARNCGHSGDSFIRYPGEILGHPAARPEIEITPETEIMSKMEVKYPDRRPCVD